MDAYRARQPDNLTLYTTEEAARLLGLHRQTLAGWRAGYGNVELPFVKIGRAVRYRHSDIVAYIKSNTFKNTTESGG